MNRRPLDHAHAVAARAPQAPGACLEGLFA